MQMYDLYQGQVNYKRLFLSWPVSTVRAVDSIPCCEEDDCHLVEQFPISWNRSFSTSSQPLDNLSHIMPVNLITQNFPNTCN
jgi:hypothetical protein